MATRRKIAKRNKYAKQDARDSRIFMMVLIGITLALVILMYFIFT